MHGKSSVHLLEVGFHLALSLLAAKAKRETLPRKLKFSCLGEVHMSATKAWEQFVLMGTLFYDINHIPQ